MPACSISAGGQDDAALAVEGKLLGIGEQGRRQIVMLVGEQIDRVELAC